MLQAVVFGSQDLIELFDENEEFVMIFFYGDEGTEFMDAIGVSFVHVGETGCN